MTKLNHSSTDFTDYCVKFYSNKLECFMTKFNHSSTEFIDETLNQTLCWVEQDSHPITTKNKSSHSQHCVRPPLASVQAWLALFLLMSTRDEQAGKPEECSATLWQAPALAHAMSPCCSKVGAFSPVNSKRLHQRRKKSSVYSSSHEILHTKY